MMRDTGAAEGAAPTPVPVLVTTSSGVVFRLRRPSASAITWVEREMAPQRPKPPVLRNEDKGRDEENPADPDYIAALEDYYGRVLERRYDVVIITGTAVESVPEDVPAVNDPAWLEDAVALHIPIPEAPKEKYLLWVKLVAAPSNDDLSSLYYPLRRLVGTTEEDVAAAIATFRGEAEQRAD